MRKEVGGVLRGAEGKGGQGDGVLVEREKK